MKTGVVILSLSQLSPESRSAVPPGKKTALEAALLEALLDLVDRYWSGCKSLRGNEAFLGESGRDSCLSMQTHVWAHPPGSVLLVVLSFSWVLGSVPFGPSSSAVTVPACCRLGP